MIALWLVACIEYKPVGAVTGRVAVTQGDFDDVQSTLDRMDVASDAYEGLISSATWDDGYDPDDVALKVEGLFGLGTDPQLSEHGAAIVSSGTRGLGDVVYNGLDADDEFLVDDDVVADWRGYVAQPGHVLVVTDWAYDLIERAWPDAVDWAGDDTVPDAAQQGDIGTVTASVDDRRLRQALDEDVAAVTFDFSKWAVPESVDVDADVWMTADVSWTDADGVEHSGQQPILVTLYPNGRDKGRVVYFAYHWDAQEPAVLDPTITTVVGEMPTGTDRVDPL